MDQNTIPPNPTRPADLATHLQLFLRLPREGAVRLVDDIKALIAGNPAGAFLKCFLLDIKKTLDLRLGEEKPLAYKLLTWIDSTPGS